MSFWSMITGQDSIGKTLDITEKTVDGVINGLDKIAWTSEEKEDAYIKRLEIADQVSKTHIELMKATHAETTARSISRRIVAIFVMSLTALSMLSICIVYLFDKDFAEFILKVVQYFQVGWAFIAVIVFFFGNHLARGIDRIIGGVKK